MEIIDAPRVHCGFGSGTQIILATAVGFLRINGLSVSIDDLALLLGRGKRSAIGLTIFKRGGLVVDGGTPTTLDSDKGVPKPLSLSILLVRHSFPKDWRLVIVIPKKFKGISGRKEKQAFRKLNPSNLHHVQKISQALLLKLLPSILEKDIHGFGEALTSIQRWVGKQFKPAQYSQFGNPVSEKLIRQLLKWGVAGSGQSSWGPVVYGLVEGNREAKRIQLKLEEKYPSDSLTVLISEADNRGHRVIESW